MPNKYFHSKSKPSNGLISGLVILCFCLVSCATSNKHVKHMNDLTSFRQDYKAAFLTDAHSPLKVDDLPLLDFYPEDSTWKMQCSCMIMDQAKPFEMPLYSGITRSYAVHSIATCMHNGREIRLHIYKNATQNINPLYKNSLFLPFKDETNGEETYGGGRYIDLKVSDIVNNQVTIDFNKCYNPWCAYSDGYNCPIPPKENNLPFPIQVGEKMYKGSYKSRSLH